MSQLVSDQIKKSGAIIKDPGIFEAKDIDPGILPKLETIVSLKQRKWIVEFYFILECEHWNVREIKIDTAQILNEIKIDKAGDNEEFFPPVAHITVMATCSIQALSNN